MTRLNQVLLVIVVALLSFAVGFRIGVNLTSRPCAPVLTVH